MASYELIHDRKRETVRIKYSFEDAEITREPLAWSDKSQDILIIKPNLAQMRAAGRASVEVKTQTSKRKSSEPSFDWEKKDVKWLPFRKEKLLCYVAQNMISNERILSVRHPITLKAGEPYKLAIMKDGENWRLKWDTDPKNRIPKQFEELDENGSPRVTEGYTAICLKPRWIMQAGQLTFKGWHEPTLALSNSVANDWRFWYAQREYKIDSSMWEYINPAERFSKDVLITRICAGHQMEVGISMSFDRTALNEVFSTFQLAQMNDLRGIEYQPESELVL